MTNFRLQFFRKRYTLRLPCKASGVIMRKKIESVLVSAMTLSEDYGVDLFVLFFGKCGVLRAFCTVDDLGGGTRSTEN